MGIIGAFSLATAGPAFAKPVGTGIYNCAAVKGSIYFKPKLITGGVAVEHITINFKATGCAGGLPLEPAVKGTASYVATQKNVCPMLGVNGAAVLLHLTYPFAAPSVATVAVSEAAGLWTLAGPVAGSYPSLLGTATLKPTPVAGQNCGAGVGVKHMTFTTVGLAAF
jgi:hypothetical protein